MKLAIGFFDGLHLGHRRILDGAEAVLTFRNHPLSVLRPAAAPCLLMSAEARLAALAADGRRVTALDFTSRLAQEEPAAFVAYLRRTFPDLAAIRCGANWRFGRGGAGDAAFLKSCGVAVETVPFASWNGAPVSSTRIRAALADGRADAAAAMLGHSYAVTGRIVAGKGVGRTLGYPTLNLDPGRPLPLRQGVWCVETPFGTAVANWGSAPTAGKAAWASPILEVHVLEVDVSQPWPPAGATLTVSFRTFLRDECRFASYEELSRQIARDVSACRHPPIREV